MKNNDNPYDILGVSKEATPAEIKKAFRAKAKGAHPDRGGDGETFKQLNAAYEILKDPNKRRIFDETGSVGGVNAYTEARHKVVVELVLSAMEVGVNDILAFVAERTKNFLNDSNDKIKKERKKIKTAQKLMKRLKKAPEDDPVTAELQRRIESAKAQIREIEGLKMLFTEAGEIVQNSYDFEAPELDEEEKVDALAGMLATIKERVGGDEEFPKPPPGRTGQWF